MEDVDLIDRIRAQPDRHVYTISCGNTSPDQAHQYIRIFKQKLKQKLKHKFKN